MTTVKIKNIDVKFPYEKPYNIQIEYMTKVIECLEDKSHGVLESPTGTGKTLCLFAPVTSWLRSKKKLKQAYLQNPEAMNGQNVFTRQRVLYTARTHSQIAQTVSEVRRCDIEGLRINVMGARDQLCVNPVVLSEKESYIKTIKCKELVKSKSCRFYNNYSKVKESEHTIFEPGQVLDIEDMVKEGRRCGVCPYFLAKDAKDRADVVLMPYNYIIDQETRDKTAGYQNVIIIFDEGHNVASTCEESFEFAVTSVDIALGISNLQELMQSLANMMKTDGDEEFDVAMHAESSLKLVMVLKELEVALNQNPVSDNLMNLDELHKFFHSAGVNHETAMNYLQRLDQMKADSVKLQLSGPTISTITLMERIFHCLYGEVISKVIAKSPDTIKSSFKYVVSKDTSNYGVNNSKKLSLFCFNPSFGMEDILLLGVQSVIITSGTLSPLAGLISELGLKPQPVTLENCHIADKSQVPFMILGSGVDGERFDGSFKNRDNPKYVRSLGESLINLIKSIPDGVLLLFSSYSVMQKLNQTWEAEINILRRLNKEKKVFVEPRGKEEFINCMENYRRAIDAGNGALLMGVIRGKISEGMDFKDQYCRGVFLVGVPYPPARDPRVTGKGKYVEALTTFNPVTKKEEKLYKNAYMAVEAMRATNQAIGRVIRHGGDYGAVILCDYRFAFPNLFFYISRWLRGNVPKEVNYSVAKRELGNFFKAIHKGEIGVNEILCQAVSDNGVPKTAENKYDVYDHKKAMDENCTPDISAGPDFRIKLGRSTIRYDDSEGDLVNSYQKFSSSSSYSSQSYSSTSSFEALDSPSASRIQYKEISMDVLGAELQKRKLHESSSSILCRQPKKPRQRTMFPSLSQAIKSEPEPENIINDKMEKRDDFRARLVNYFFEAKKLLQPEQSEELKTVTHRYFKGILPLTEAVIILRKLLSDPHKQHLISGFQQFVMVKDSLEWQTFVESQKCPS